MASNGYQRSTGRLGRAFGAPDEAQDPYAINTPMAQIDPRSNPYGQGGGLRGRLRDALLAGGSAGHNRNRMAPVMNARMFDRGMAPEQQNYMAEQRAQQQYQQQQQENQRLQQERDEGKKRSAAGYVDYAKWAHQNGQQAMGMRTWLSMSEADRSKATQMMAGFGPGMGAAGPAALQEMDALTQHQKLASGTEPGNPEWNEHDVWVQTYWQRLRAEQKFTQQGVEQFRSADGSVTIPGTGPQPSGRGSPSEAAGIPGARERNTALETAAQGERDAASSTEYQTKMATGQADMDTAFGSSANELVNSLRQQLGNTVQLREMIETDPGFQNTGPWEQFYTTWSDENTAELAADSIYETLMNLQVTKLTPVSNEEIKMISMMWADVAKDPKANIGALKSAERRLATVLNELQNKRKHWFANEESLKGYNLVDPDADWTQPLPGTYGTTQKGQGAPTRGAVVLSSEVLQ